MLFFYLTTLSVIRLRLSFGWMKEIRARSVFGMILTDETEVRGEKPFPMPICSPQIQEGGEY